MLLRHLPPVCASSRTQCIVCWDQLAVFTDKNLLRLLVYFIPAPINGIRHEVPPPPPPPPPHQTKHSSPAYHRHHRHGRPQGLHLHVPRRPRGGRSHLLRTRSVVVIVVVAVVIVVVTTPHSLHSTPLHFTPSLLFSLHLLPHRAPRTSASQS